MKEKLILFIHGLGGHGEKTWQSKSTSFPELITNDDNLSKQYDTDYYQYPTSLFGIPFLTKAPKLQTLSDGLRTQIKNKYSKYKSIVFICHSLGGLIARQYLLDEIKNNQQLLVEKLLLFAVPNEGSHLAPIADLISWKHYQLSQLCKDSDLLHSLNEDWARFNIEEKLDIKYVVAGLDKVVQERSAKNFWGNKRVETIIDRGHIDIVKPQSKEDLSFGLLKNFIDQKREDVIVVDYSHRQNEWNGLDEFLNAIQKDKVSISSDLIGSKNIIDRSSVLVISLPYQSQFTKNEVRYIKSWVENGGGLFFMGYYAADTHHGGNPRLMISEFDYEFQDNLILPPEIDSGNVRRHVFNKNEKYAVKLNVKELNDHPILNGIDEVGFQSSCSISTQWGSPPELVLSSPSDSKIWTPEGPKGPEGWSRKIIEKWNFESKQSVPLLVAFEHGKGRVVISSTWKITTLDYADNKKFVINILDWLSQTTPIK